MRIRKCLKIAGAALLAGTLSGCMAHDQAKDVSRNLLAQTIAYENQLVSLSRVTQTHGKTVRDWARKSIDDAYSLSLESSVVPSARDMVEHLGPAGLTEKGIRSFIRNLETERRQHVALTNAKMAEVNSRAQKTVTNLKREIKPLGAVRAKLEKLQQGPSYADHLETLKPILDLIKTKIDTPS